MNDNILITSIGSLSAPFVIQTLKKLGNKITGIDIYPQNYVFASKFIDNFYQVPPVSDTKLYKNFIFKILNKQKINLIVPLTDVDVDFYCEFHNLFNNKGVFILSPDPENTLKMRDKKFIYDKLLQTRIKVIPTSNIYNYNKEIGFYPCIAKKRNGRSSIGQFIFNNNKQLKCFLKDKNDYIIQPFLEGNIIVTDIIFNKNEKLYISREELIRTANGAGITIKIIKNYNLKVILNEFHKLFPIKGYINIEFLKTDKGFYLMDINPRFSAGIKFSFLGGYNFVENLYNIYKNKKLKKICKVNYNFVYTRKFEEVQVNN